MTVTVNYRMPAERPSQTFHEITDLNDANPAVLVMRQQETYYTHRMIRIPWDRIESVVTG